MASCRCSAHPVHLMPATCMQPHISGTRMIPTMLMCDAVVRANMRFVATKTPEQQSCLTLHRTRHLFIR